MGKKGVEPKGLRRYRLAHRKVKPMAKAGRAARRVRRAAGRGGRPGGHRSSPKRPSLVMVLGLIAAGSLVSAKVASAANGAMAAAAPLLLMVGITTGAGALAAAIAAKGACSLSPWWGAKWRGFLAGWGLRP